ncbi:hypothetical protein [Methanolobus profundi]|uniref:Uncharacterized protein n=1 Tax=Methanolobus profundi TaxID=487685 RepID=A0A1I4S740_9EURY|nr:hypothetical protein [Methanolobus profundi]SFM60083.1 hypothetical protein SAMN04488696_1803 [Methanolobus profundi]
MSKSSAKTKKSRENSIVALILMLLLLVLSISIPALFGAPFLIGLELGSTALFMFVILHLLVLGFKILVQKNIIDFSCQYNEGIVNGIELYFVSMIFVGIIVSYLIPETYYFSNQNLNNIYIFLKQNSVIFVIIGVLLGFISRVENILIK